MARLPTQVGCGLPLDLRGSGAVPLEDVMLPDRSSLRMQCQTIR